MQTTWEILGGLGLEVTKLSICCRVDESKQNRDVVDLGGALGEEGPALGEDGPARGDMDR